VQQEAYIVWLCVGACVYVPGVCVYECMCVPV